MRPSQIQRSCRQQLKCGYLRIKHRKPGKGEIAHFEQFHLFPQCFPKFFFNVLKLVYMEERVKNLLRWTEFEIILQECSLGDHFQKVLAKFLSMNMALVSGGILHYMDMKKFFKKKNLLL